MKIKNSLITLAFFFLALYFILICAYSIYRINFPVYIEDAFDQNLKLYYLYAFFISVIIIILLIFIYYYLSSSIKIYISIILYSIFFSIYTFEIYFEIFLNKSENEIRASLAERNNIKFDERTKLEIYFEMKNDHDNLYLSPAPYSFVTTDGLIFEDTKIFPLGGISNSIGIMSNESGYYPIINRDEFGFRNPSGLYAKKIDVMLIGDSFVEGVAVNFDDSIQGNFLKKNINTISLGSGGNGPLVELATIIEYAQYFKPNNVIWFYFENDIKDLEYELKSNLLKKYLDDVKYSQNLINKQEIIDFVLINKSIGEIKNYNRNTSFDIYYKHKIIKILKLYNLRKIFGFQANSSKPSVNTSLDHKLRKIFYKILLKASQIVNGWGGNFYFVYLTDFSNYYRDKSKMPHRNEIIEFLRKNKKFDFIDIHTELMSTLENPKSLYPFQIKGHYNEEGYKKISEIVIDKFNLDIKK